jgi:hypothetical protein
MKKVIIVLWIIIFLLNAGCKNSTREIIIVDNWYKYTYKNFIYPLPGKEIVKDTSYLSDNVIVNKISKMTNGKEYDFVDSLIVNKLANQINNFKTVNDQKRGIMITIVVQKQITTNGKDYLVSNFEVSKDNTVSRYITVDNYGFIFKQYDMGPTYILKDQQKIFSNYKKVNFDPSEIIKIIMNDTNYFEKPPAISKF